MDFRAEHRMNAKSRSKWKINSGAFILSKKEKDNKLRCGNRCCPPVNTACSRHAPLSIPRV